MAPVSSTEITAHPALLRSGSEGKMAEPSVKSLPDNRPSSGLRIQKTWHLSDPRGGGASSLGDGKMPEAKNSPGSPRCRISLTAANASSDKRRGRSAAQASQTNLRWNV
eukprot:4564582-Pyramimonas_sp.AAC.1